MNYSREEKANWLTEWRQSGKSISAFVKEKGLVRWTFTKWIKAERESKACFIDVSAQIVNPARQIPEIVIEKGNVKIYIPLVISGNELRAVIEGFGAVL